MSTPRVTCTAGIAPEGQIAIPKALLDILHAQPGDSLGLVVEADGALRISRGALRARDVAGMLASRSHVKSSVEEMDEAVAEAFRKGEL